MITFSFLCLVLFHFLTTYANTYFALDVKSSFARGIKKNLIKLAFHSMHNHLVKKLDFHANLTQIQTHSICWQSLILVGLFSLSLKPLCGTKIESNTQGKYALNLVGLYLSFDTNNISTNLIMYVWESCSWKRYVQKLGYIALLYQHINTIKCHTCYAYVLKKLLQ